MKIGGEQLFLYWGGIGARGRSAADAGGCVQMRCKGGITPIPGQHQAHKRPLPERARRVAVNVINDTTWRSE